MPLNYTVLITKNKQCSRRLASQFPSQCRSISPKLLEIHRYFETWTESHPSQLCPSSSQSSARTSTSTLSGQQPEDQKHRPRPLQPWHHAVSSGLSPQHQHVNNTSSHVSALCQPKRFFKNHQPTRGYTGNHCTIRKLCTWETMKILKKWNTNILLREVFVWGVFVLEPPWIWMQIGLDFAESLGKRILFSGVDKRMHIKDLRA